jgi:[CysO sulfur-carrier protein]-S-L-cysteine hydrolase
VVTKHGVTLGADVAGDERPAHTPAQVGASESESSGHGLVSAGAAPEGAPAVEAPSDLAVAIGAPVLARANVRLPAALLQQLIDWARAGLPNEACGIVAGDRFATDGGKPLTFHGLTNTVASPYRYLIDPAEQLKVMTQLDEADEVVWGIFHSHVASPAEPSPTDLELAFYPGSLYLICSLTEQSRPVVRAWTLNDGGPAEITLEIA